MKDKKTKIIVKWIFGLTVLTFAFFLIILFYAFAYSKNKRIAWEDW